MRFRVATLNLEQDHKRWGARRELVQAEIGRLKPDVMAFNEECIPLQSARDPRDATRPNQITRNPGAYSLTQQKVRSVPGHPVAFPIA
jgi:hypothetical protein